MFIGSAGKISVAVMLGLVVLASADTSPDGSINCGNWLYTTQCPAEKPCYTVSDVDPVTGQAHKCTTPPTIVLTPVCHLPSHEWTAIDTVAGSSMSYGMAADKVTGHMFIAGTFKDKLKFQKEGAHGSTTGTVELTVATETGEHDDLYVIQVGGDGTHSKHWIFAGQGKETLIDVAFKNDKLALVGYQIAESPTIPGKITFPLIAGGNTEFTNTKDKYYDAFVAVLDTTKGTGQANVIWAASQTNEMESKFFAVDIDTAGNVVAVGHTCYEDPNPPANDPTSVCGTWTYTAQCGTDTPCYTGSQVNPATGTAHSCAAPPDSPPPAFICDAIIQKYDNTGTRTFSQNFVSLNDEKNALWGVKTDEAGSIFVVGVIKGANIDLGGDCGAFSSVSANGKSALIMKFNSNLHCMWAKALGSTETDMDNSAWDLVVSGDHVYVVGSNSGEAPRNNALFEGTNSGYLVKLRKDNGTPVWGADIPNARGVDANVAGDAIYLMGLFSGQATFEIGDSDNVQLYSRGSTDVYVAKVDISTGKGLWAMDSGGEQTEYPWMLELDKDDNIYFCGLTQSPELHYHDSKGAASSEAGVSRMFVTKLNGQETIPECLDACGQVKSGWCFIHNYCYKNGDSSPYSGVGDCLKCMAAENQNMWSHDSSSNCYIDGKCVASGSYKTKSSGAQSVCEICDLAHSETSWRVLNGFAIIGDDECISLDQVQCGIVGSPSVWCDGNHPCLDLHDGVCKSAPSCPSGSAYDSSKCAAVSPCLKDGECGDAMPVEPDCGEWSYAPQGCHEKYHDSWIRQPKPCYDWRHNEHSCKAPSPPFTMNPVSLPKAEHYVTFQVLFSSYSQADFNVVKQQLFKEALASLAETPVTKVFITEVASQTARRSTGLSVTPHLDFDTADDALAAMNKIDAVAMNTALRAQGIVETVSFIKAPVPDSDSAARSTPAPGGGDGKGGLSSVAVAMITLGSCFAFAGILGGGYVAYKKRMGDAPGWGMGRLESGVSTGVPEMKLGHVSQLFTMPAGIASAPVASASNAESAS